jgi:hypothetical protein
MTAAWRCTSEDMEFSLRCFASTFICSARAFFSQGSLGREASFPVMSPSGP